MATLKTHRISSDDETLYHSSESNIGNKKISTPIKTIDPKLITSTLDFNSSIKGIYEIYKILNQDKIEAITTDTHRQLQFNQELTKLSNKVKSDEISLFF